MILAYAVYRLVTSNWVTRPWAFGPVVRSKVHSTRDAAVAIVENDAVSTLLPQLVASREESNSLAESACRISSTSRDSHAPLSCVPKDAQQVAEDTRIRGEANRQQFHVELLEDCSFFARLVVRHVRAGGNASGDLLDRDSPRKKRNVVQVSQTFLRPRSTIGSRSLLLEERALQPEASSSSSQRLWIEVGCRHAHTLVSEKERS
jgi:hypothetical protein